MYAINIGAGAAGCDLLIFSHLTGAENQKIAACGSSYTQLQQIIAGLSDGVILLELDQTLLWVNDAALAMHGVGQLSELGANAKEYAKRFALRYRRAELFAVGL
jgi:PAS domain-containing protein